MYQVSQGVQRPATQPGRESKINCLDKASNRFHQHQCMKKVNWTRTIPRCSNILKWELSRCYAKQYIGKSYECVLFWNKPENHKQPHAEKASVKDMSMLSGICAKLKK